MQTKKITPILEVFIKLKQLTDNKSGAVQVDGSKVRHPNRNAFLFFEYHGQIYGLAGDTTMKAAKRFIDLSVELGSPTAALKMGLTKKDQPCLKLVDGSPKGKGWYCYTETWFHNYVRKRGSRSTRKAA